MGYVNTHIHIFIHIVYMGRGLFHYKGFETANRIVMNWKNNLLFMALSKNAHWITHDVFFSM